MNDCFGLSKRWRVPSRQGRSLSTAPGPGNGRAKSPSVRPINTGSDHGAHRHEADPTRRGESQDSPSPARVLGAVFEAVSGCGVELIPRFAAYPLPTRFDFILPLDCEDPEFSSLKKFLKRGNFLKRSS